MFAFLAAFIVAAPVTFPDRAPGSFQLASITTTGAGIVLTPGEVIVVTDGLLDLSDATHTINFVELL